jgi:hypothetical protein
MKMPKCFSPYLFLGFIFCLLLSLLSACQKEMVDAKGTLEKQAERYWNERMINKNFKYTYEEEVKEGLPPFSTYEEKMKIVNRISTLSVKVTEVKVEGKNGIVKLVARCQIPKFPSSVDIPMGDRWVIEGNKWKHLLQVKF